MFDGHVANPHYAVHFTVIPAQMKSGFIRRRPLASKPFPFCTAGIEHCQVHQQKPRGKGSETLTPHRGHSHMCPQENHQEHKLIQPNRPFVYHFTWNLLPMAVLLPSPHLTPPAFGLFSRELKYLFDLMED